MSRLTLINRTGRAIVWPRRALTAVWRQAKARDVVVVLVGSMESRRLNKIYRHRDYPTNVLSFGSVVPDKSGDIIICYSLARAEARAQGITPSERLVYLFAHGLLHLAGYDHQTAAEEKRLARALKKILL